MRVPAVKTVYCMNEAEMVDVALGILIEGHKQEEPWKQPGHTDKPPRSSSCAGSPRTSSPGSSSEEEDGGKNTTALGLSPSQGPGASNSTCNMNPEEEKEEEEEDLLKYVREIFFS
uniref:cell cycle regulator of non-homologous end joining isoform X2 n=1 Tax=Jaculus jaculus TaxID=51337 RepID=UPI001E1B103D|nr:cell cycle regulator of non-homologous end joining isoform X2 [Jaculus jaculus]